MKPIIGVVGRPEILTSGTKIFYINQEINTAIIKNGGNVNVIVPSITNNLSVNINEEQLNEIKRQINNCDGIICQGGNDFYDYDLKIIKYCYENNIPLLGICLGMQAMSCLFNGIMQKLKTNRHKTKDLFVHKVKINKNSKLYDIFKTETLQVNSRHINYITKTSLKTVGISDDNLIEAVEDTNKKFFIGVQWHPETMIEYDILENNLFSYFIDCCRR